MCPSLLCADIRNRLLGISNHLLLSQNVLFVFSLRSTYTQYLQYLKELQDCNLLITYNKVSEGIKLIRKNQHSFSMVQTTRIFAIFPCNQQQTPEHSAHSLHQCTSPYDSTSTVATSNPAERQMLQQHLYTEDLCTHTHGTASLQKKNINPPTSLRRKSPHRSCLTS